MTDEAEGCACLLDVDLVGCGFPPEPAALGDVEEVEVEDVEADGDELSPFRLATNALVGMGITFDKWSGF